MYSNKLVLAIKNNGKILRELKDTVYVPYGSEFSLLIKNLNTVRCLVSVFIDGKNVAEGSDFVISPGSSLDLERYMVAGNRSSGNRFKFIERTASIENSSRGIKLEDGLVRIEFEFEREAPTRQHYLGDRITKGMDGEWDSRLARGLTSSTLSSTLSSRGISGAMGASAAAASSDEISMHVSVQSENGITVPGSVSNQRFTEVAGFPTDGVKHSMVLKLAGDIGQNAVTAPITVKTKLICAVCDTVNQIDAKFCRECGAALHIV